MFHIAAGFQGENGRLEGESITARGLHGLLYNVLKQIDPRQTTWLHKHPAPKPYTMVPYYDDSGALHGLRLAALTKPAADLIHQAWLQAHHSGQTLFLGQQPLRVNDVATIPGPGFEALATSAARPDVGLDFLSPTSFRQGPGHLPLPLPKNVFDSPYRVWETFAPPTLRLPRDWPDWCERNVFVVGHDIQTAAVTISKREPPFVGFVGRVWFEARSDALLYLSVLQALAGLAAFSGVGHKTTMGMGAVEQIE